MSQQYDNTLRGALFVNERKQQPSHPDYKGSLADADGREYWVSAWIKTPRNGGEDFISLALTPKDENQPPRTQPAQVSSNARDFLQRNADKINAHQPARPAQQPAQPARPPATPDYDSIDDEIPF